MSTNNEPLVQCQHCKLYVPKSEIVEIEKPASKVMKALLTDSILDNGKLGQPTKKQVCRKCIAEFNARHSK